MLVFKVPKCTLPNKIEQYIVECCATHKKEDEKYEYAVYDSEDEAYRFLKESATEIYKQESPKGPTKLVFSGNDKASVISSNGRHKWTWRIDVNKDDMNTWTI